MLAPRYSVYTWAVPAVGDTIGRYTLESQLGVGGMGIVFRAFDNALRRQVAFKLMLVPHGAMKVVGEWSARMLREARAAAAFNHPNAVAVYDVGAHEGAPYIVMELVAGSSLRSLLDGSSPALPERLRWLIDVARALGAAHRAGLVHRDVKPDNVMVRGDGVVKVLDFGIARGVQHTGDGSESTVRDLETVTQAGAVLGTPAYMSPEQLRRQPLDGRSDQFSWGVMAYQVLGGRLPFGGDDIMSLGMAILTEEPPPLDVVCSDVPSAVVAVVRRALSKRPEDRFQTMEDAAAALETYITAPSLPAVAARSASVAPVKPRARTRPALLVGAAALAVLIAAVAWLALGGALSPRRVASMPSTAATSQTSAAAAPLQRPCAQADARGCASPMVAWCGDDDKPMACCAKGLVAVGREGLCGCPRRERGHSGRPADLSQAIQRPWANPASRARPLQGSASVLRGHASQGRNRAGRRDGELRAEPGRPRHACACRQASLPDADAQVCLLEVFRSIVFDPPAGGYATISYPITFTVEP